PQTAHAGREEILTEHVARELALEAARDLAHERRVSLEQLLREHGVEPLPPFGGALRRWRRGDEARSSSGTNTAALGPMPCRHDRRSRNEAEARGGARPGNGRAGLAFRVHLRS